MQYITLNHAISFYIPSTKGSKKINQAEFKNRTERIANEFTKLFGGATIERVQGFYTMKDGSYETETINKVVSFCSDTDLEINSSKVFNLAKKAKKEYEQESIGLEIDNKFYLID